jgi:fatty acid desaturase
MRKIKLTPNQIDHLIQWLIQILLVILILFFVPIPSWIIFILISSGFLVAVILRSFNFYPGKDEPLKVDISSALIAFFTAVISFFLVKYPLFLIISKLLIPFVILIPHFIYIISNKKLGPSGLIKIKKRR